MSIPPKSMEAQPMRVPRVRFSLRAMMIVVAIVAVVVGGLCALKSRRDRFHRIAADCSSRLEGPYELPSAERPLIAVGGILYVRQPFPDPEVERATYLKLTGQKNWRVAVAAKYARA